MAVHQKWSNIWVLVDSANHTWHQITNNDEVRDTDTKALDGNSGIEEDGRRWICDLRQREERRGSAWKVAGSARLEVETKRCATGGPDNDNKADEETKLSHSQRHGEGTSTNNYMVVSR